MNEKDLKDLAKFRKLVEFENESIKERQNDLEKTDEFQKLQLEKKSRDDCQKMVDELTAKIKADALADSKAMYNPETKTYGKPVLVGLGLRVNKTLKYIKETAELWAKENAKMLFKMDWKAFEDMAKKIEIPGVEIIDEPTITIASDLSSYLE